MGAKTNREGVSFGGAFEGILVDTFVIHQHTLDGLQDFCTSPAIQAPSRNDLGWSPSCARTPGAARRGLELRIDRRGKVCTEVCSSPSRPDATCRLIVNGLCEPSRSIPKRGSLRRAKRALQWRGWQLGGVRTRQPAIWRLVGLRRVRPPLRDDWSKLTENCWTGTFSSRAS
jgi:hypothetical protein